MGRIHDYAANKYSLLCQSCSEGIWLLGRWRGTLRLADPLAGDRIRERVRDCQKISQKQLFCKLYLHPSHSNSLSKELIGWHVLSLQFFTALIGWHTIFHLLCPLLPWLAYKLYSTALVGFLTTPHCPCWFIDYTQFLDHIPVHLLFSDYTPQNLIVHRPYSTAFVAFWLHLTVFAGFLYPNALACLLLIPHCPHWFSDQNSLPSIAFGLYHIALAGF